MADTAPDTLALARSLEQTGMPGPEAQAIARTAGKAVSGHPMDRRKIVVTFAGVGVRSADALAALLARPAMPKAGTFVDTLSLSQGLEAEGMAASASEALLSFLYEREPRGRRRSISTGAETAGAIDYDIFSTAHSARALAYATLPTAVAEALARVLYDARKGKKPDSLTVAHKLKALGLAATQADALTLCLFQVLKGSPENRSFYDLVAAGIPHEHAFALHDFFYYPANAEHIIDTLTIAHALQTAGMAPAAAAAFADVCLDIATLALGAVIGTLALSRKLARGGMPLPQATAIALILYRLKAGSFRILPGVREIGRTLEAAGVKPAHARTVALALRTLATWPASDGLADRLAIRFPKDAG